MKEHHKCSASRDYTHTVYPTSLRDPNQKSSGKKMDSDPDSNSTMACVWWRNPQPSVASKQGESTRGRRKEEEREENLSQIEMNKKGTLPPLYRPKEGGNLLQLPMWDYSQREEGVAHLEGWAPLFGAMSHGGGLPLPLMGPMRPIC